MCKHGGCNYSFSSLCPPRKFWQNIGHWWYINNILYVHLEEEMTWYKIRKMRWSGDSAISQSISMETSSARGLYCYIKMLRCSVLLEYLIIRVLFSQVGLRNSSNMARCNTLATIHSTKYTDLGTALHIHCCCCKLYYVG